LSGADTGLAISVFLASAVEAVEAFTIVLAVGGTRGWSSVYWGVGAASLVLACVIAILGPALTLLPIDLLRLLVGSLLLIFGLQWLRKAILHAGGAKAMHDEAAIYEREVATAEAPVGEEGLDSYAFAIAFKAVLLEGLEVAFIVVTLGANQGNVPLAAAAGALAVLFVLVFGLMARAPLSRVPENAMKFAVGVLLTSFGIFWGAEGAGVTWPGEEAALALLVGLILLGSWLMVYEVRGAQGELGGARG
jgi:uncharacterized membrane protein